MTDTIPEPKTMATLAVGDKIAVRYVGSIVNQHPEIRTVAKVHKLYVVDDKGARWGHHGWHTKRGERRSYFAQPATEKDAAEIKRAMRVQLFQHLKDFYVNDKYRHHRIEDELTDDEITEVCLILKDAKKRLVAKHEVPVGQKP